jgi:DNA-binding transcriptional LysR family regulator
MDISALRIFVDVARRGSFAAVARGRDTDPSSISRSVAALEAELGVRLFQRNTRRLALTEAGAIYLERVEPLLGEMEHANQAATEVSGHPRGVLRVTASISFGQKCLVPVLPAFAAAYPKIIVDLLLTDTVIDILTERVDLAIRLGPLSEPALAWQRLLRATYSVCASPDYLRRRGTPRHPQELKDHDCLLFPLAGFRSRWIFRDREKKLTQVPVQGRVLISSGIALEQCAVAGMGLALLPQWIVGSDLKSGTLINVFPDYEVTATDFDTSAWLLYPSRTRMPTKVRVFVDYLKKEIRERPPWLR